MCNPMNTISLPQLDCAVRQRWKYLTDVIKQKIILVGLGKQGPKIRDGSNGSSSVLLLALRNKLPHVTRNDRWLPGPSDLSPLVARIQISPWSQSLRGDCCRQPAPQLQLCESLSEGSTYSCPNTRTTDTVGLIGVMLSCHLWELLCTTGD